MLGRIVQESTYIDATVIGVHGDKELLYLETPEQEEVPRRLHTLHDGIGTVRTMLVP